LAEPPYRPSPSVRLTRRPVPADIDEWTHYLYDPSNNAVSRDLVVAPPRRMQWVGSPRYSRHHDRMSSVSAVVSSGGASRGAEMKVTPSSSKITNRQSGIVNQWCHR